MKERETGKSATVQRILSLILSLSILLSQSACSNTSSTSILSDPNSSPIAENVIPETTIAEDVLAEFITEEIYLKEIVVAEDKIVELLLEEETISEIILCKTIYVPQDNIEEFAKNSQTAQIFGDSVDILPLLTKIAVGTGVIVTLTILNKVGVADPIASVIAAAADESLKFGKTGAAIGSLLGGLTGAADAIDESGRASAVVEFAAATAGMILSIVSLVAVVPSGGSTTITVAAGIKLVVAGISVLTGMAGTTYAGYQAVKTFTSTDATDIDWNNIDWERVGISAAEKVIKNAADGYVWGAIVGAVHGGVEGYDHYQKYNTPYTEYDVRLQQTPKEGNRGKWSGERGESDFILDEPIVRPDGTKITQITYENAVPDFSPYQEAQVDIPRMTGNRAQNFGQADQALAEYWTHIKQEGKIWTSNDVEVYRRSNNFTWHEMSNMNSMQLVPSEVNQTFTHCGGVAEYNAMIGQNGGSNFD